MCSYFILNIWIAYGYLRIEEGRFTYAPVKVNPDPSPQPQDIGGD